jgi:predicted nucleotidyltransferase component of viral defense system
VINNVQSLKDKARNIAKLNNLTIQEVLQNYMFECFLDRLSKSKYKHNFIIKGGLLLSSIMGINLRTTMDIDTNITGIDFKRAEIEKILIEILNIDVNDNVFMSIEKVEDIKENDEYGGFKFKILSMYSNLKIPFHIDVSTGDIITPRAIEYKYKKILEDEYIDIITYNKETIIAEKLQTILNRKISNSRMKDFYDIYYFTTYKWNEIDKEILNKSIKTTFEKRDSRNRFR